MAVARYQNGQIIALIRPTPGNAGVLATLEGRKAWLRSGELSVVASGHNIAMFKVLGVEVPDNAVEPVRTGPVQLRSTKAPKMRARTYQTEALVKARRAARELGKKVFALFMDQGTGKTKVAYDWAAELWAAREIDAMVVVSLKGVHEQWALQQAIEHLGIPYVSDFWRGRKVNPRLFGNADYALPIFTTNVDSLRSKKAVELLQHFIMHHGGRVLFVIDESQAISNPTSQRKKVAKELGLKCSHRMIATGTPLSKSLQDVWSQMDFLDESIIGIKYITTFRAQYCIMGGFENKSIVANKNIEEFQKRIEPYCYRVTKKDVLPELPEKIREKWVFDLDQDTRRHYDSLRKNFLTTVEGSDFTVQNAGVLTVRLQQLARGMLVNEDGSVVQLPDNSVAALQDLLEKYADRRKILIWSHLVPQIKKLSALLSERGDEHVLLYGEMKPTERAAAIAAFMDENSPVRFMVANPAVGGTGLNLQGLCQTVIYFTCGYKAIDRWQSEDRTHRIGMRGDCDYIDVIARNTVDVKVLRNLAQKKSLSDHVLQDDVRDAMRNLLDDAPDDGADIEWLDGAEPVEVFVPANQKEAELIDMMRDAAGG